MNKITVFLGDDHTIFRQGMRALLNATHDIQVIGEAENGRRAVSEIIRLRPQVVLLDLSMPQLNGVEAARQIAREVPTARVLILSAFSDEHYVQHAIEAGAVGYLMKQTAADDVVQAIREIAKGNASFSPLVARRLLRQCQHNFRNVFPAGTHGLPLTSRQTEILQLVAEGNGNKQVADLLAISVKTVEKHRQLLMKQLNLHNVAELTRYAVAMGVIEAGTAPQLTAHSRQLWAQRQKSIGPGSSVNVSL